MIHLMYLFDNVADFDWTSDFVEKTNSNYNRAEKDFNTFESFKRNKYSPNGRG